ncbi:hypothetical protein GBAR_LOCUS12850 [Geodia barretti]|uniref:Uncharacterized protein n=1 Tax=Geodia barretti TaxID=519541 RepID=A0AA35S3Z5_GEOBA|nr:hypothetical protein GBAR_LOCUS12850 [Geodia barretti]
MQPQANWRDRSPVRTFQRFSNSEALGQQAPQTWRKKEGAWPWWSNNL